jgi:hypothetical protein
LRTHILAEQQLSATAVEAFVAKLRTLACATLVDYYVYFGIIRDNSFSDREALHIFPNCSDDPNSLMAGNEREPCYELAFIDVNT